MGKKHRRSGKVQRVHFRNGIDQELKLAFQQGYEAAMKDMRGETESIQMRDSVILSPATSKKVFEYFQYHTNLNEQEIRSFVYMFYFIHEEAPEWNVYGDDTPASIVKPHLYSLRLNSWGRHVVTTYGLEEIPLFRCKEGWVYKQVIKE